MNAPFTEAETDWQKAVAGLSRASGRYAGILSGAAGAGSNAPSRVAAILVIVRSG